MALEFTLALDCQDSTVLAQAHSSQSLSGTGGRASSDPT